MPHQVNDHIAKNEGLVHEYCVSIPSLLGLFCMLNECFYTTESNPFLTQMYKNDGFYDFNDCEGLEDVCLVPMNRARLVEGMKSLLMNGGKKKFTDTLRTINESADREDY